MFFNTLIKKKFELKIFSLLINFLTTRSRVLIYIICTYEHCLLVYIFNGVRLHFFKKETAIRLGRTWTTKAFSL